MKRIITAMVMLFCATITASAFANKLDLAIAKEKAYRRSQGLPEKFVPPPAQPVQLLPSQIANGTVVRCRDGHWCSKAEFHAEQGDVGSVKSGSVKSGQGACAGRTGKALASCKLDSAVPGLGEILGK